MPPQRGENIGAPGLVQLLPQFFEREMDDVVVVQFLGCHFCAQLEPDAMKEVGLLRRQMGRMRAEIEDVLLTGWKVDAEGESGLRIRQPLPRETRKSCLLVDR